MAASKLRATVLLHIFQGLRYGNIIAIAYFKTHNSSLMVNSHTVKKYITETAEIPDVCPVRQTVICDVGLYK